MAQKKYKSKRIKGKYLVYRYLSLTPRLRSYHPLTAFLSKKQWKKFIKKYGLLYIKPNNGSQGKGIFQVRKKHKGKLVLRSTKQQKKNFKNELSLFKYLKAKSRSNMIIQQGIELESVNGKPYDIRAMVQRRPGGPWRCTGIFTKVGARNKIVTNYFQGGRLLPLDKVFSSLHLSKKKRNQRHALLQKISLKTAKALHTAQPGMYEMGIDFAFDKNGRLWILEVNTRHPQFHPLKKLDPAMYRLMMSFAKSYGRYSAK